MAGVGNEANSGDTDTIQVEFLCQGCQSAEDVARQLAGFISQATHTLDICIYSFHSDEKGHVQGVIVPIELWREIMSERERAYLLNSEVMKQRLLEAMKRQDGIPFEELALIKLP